MVERRFVCQITFMYIVKIIFQNLKCIVGCLALISGHGIHHDRVSVSRD